jgi:hypothetical protein
MKDREDEKENPVSKNQKLLKAMELIKFPTYIFYFRYFYTQQQSIKTVQ